MALTFGVELQPTFCLGDSPSILLPGGKILVGNIFNKSTYLYDTAAGAWSFAANKVYGSSEEAGLTPLSDGRVLIYDINRSLNQNAGYAELYNPATNTWSSISPADGSAHGVLPVLSVPETGELGPELRMQDDRILQIGSGIALRDGILLNGGRELGRSGPSSWR